MDHAVPFPSERFNGLPVHEEIARRAVDLLVADNAVVGLYLAGSFALGRPDKYSDIDLYVVIPNGSKEEVVRRAASMVQDVGKVATWFPAAHLGDPSQLIVIYEAELPIHVDFQYKEVGELIPRSKDKDIIILLDRSGDMARYREASGKLGPPRENEQIERLQYLEDRFWGWSWYAASKIARGELWEARDAIEYMRSNVLVALADIGLGTPTEGNRRLESKYPNEIQMTLNDTIPGEHSKERYARALRALVAGFENLFSRVGEHLVSQVRRVDRDYFKRSLEELDR
jgi:predicted nucleotidyltransferase